MSPVIDGFFLTGLYLQDTKYPNLKSVRYSTCRHTYEGTVMQHHLNNGTLPVKVLTPEVKKGLTVVQTIAGSVFSGKKEILAHSDDLVTRSQIPRLDY